MNNPKHKETELEFIDRLFKAITGSVLPPDNNQSQVNPFDVVIEHFENEDKADDTN